MSDRRPTPEDAAVFLNALDKVARAPFTPEQVESLNGYQESGVMHPFTHSRDEDGEEEVLVATEEGWRCPNHPDYDQDWAWPWMADGSWEQMFILTRGTDDDQV